MDLNSQKRQIFTSNIALCGAAAVSFGIFAVLGLGFIRSSAPTYDEPVHLASGYSDLVTGRYRLNIMDHPPFAEMWAAVPLLMSRPSLFPNHPDWVAGRLYHYSDFFLYHNNISPEHMLNRARIFSMATWSGILLFAVAGWGRRIGGAGGLLGAAACFAFCPALISNLALVTTDGASSVLFFLTFWILSGARRSVRSWAAAGLCAGLANASKFNMVLLIPLALCMILAESILLPKKTAGSNSQIRRLLGKTESEAAASLVGPLEISVFLLAAFVVLAAVYRIGQLPLYIQGLAATFQRLDQGRGSFFMGRHSVTGSAAYFPVALFIKTPLPIWILSGAGLAALAGSLFDERHETARQLLWTAVPAMVYLGAAMASKVQIGYRHVLPLMPFLIVWAGSGGAWLWRRGAAGMVASLSLIVWLAGGTLRAYPYYLTYFNELAGGPANGYRYLTDSNLDWGQSISGLAKELDTLGNPPIYLSYFGSGDPAAYGIRYLPVAFVSNVEREGNDLNPSASGRILFAVSATNLQCTYFENTKLFDWLKTKSPVKVVGNSIFLYDLAGEPDAIRNLANLLALSGRPGAARDLLVKLDR